ncbi:MAG: hypothetical protein COT36_04810 [Parcubacteria group bacterium CG08_land_8_20_14_0_20_38_56]|nr:MAG: hypothetical protein COT36_04810 [Parcubacteria group bacterium CG08_land_8_20_14_0_20_38_56]
MKFTGERIIPKGKYSSPDTPEHIERYSFALDYVKAKRILDIACGAGYGSALLAEKANQVVGLDIDKDSIDYAKSHYSRQNLKFIMGDAQNFNFPDSFFDAIVSFETIEHLSSPSKFLKELKKVLKPNGILILSSPDREITKEILIDTSYKSPFHLKEFTLKELTSLLSKFFKIESIYGQFLYKPSFFNVFSRDISRWLYGFDKKKLLKKTLPLSLILLIPRKIAGMKKDPKPVPLKTNMRAQINIIICRNIK